MKDIMLLVPIEGEEHELNKIFNDIPTLMEYLKYLFQKPNGYEIIDGYFVVYDTIFDRYDNMEDIENNEASSIPAWSYFIANNNILECVKCKHKGYYNDFSDVIIDDEKRKVCPKCKSAHHKRLF